VLAARAHRELVEIRLADDDRAGGLEPLDHRRVEGRAVALEHPRGAGRRALGRRDVVLDRDGQAGEETPRRGVERVGGSQSALREELVEGVEARVRLGGPLKERGDRGTGLGAAGADIVGEGEAIGRGGGHRRTMGRIDGQAPPASASTLGTAK
jgi:hypothetical protein